MKQNKAQSTRAESTNKGVNQCFKIHKYNKDLSHLWQLSPGTCVNTRYINSTRGTSLKISYISGTIYGTCASHVHYSYCTHTYTHIPSLPCPQVNAHQVCGDQHTTFVGLQLGHGGDAIFLIQTASNACGWPSTTCQLTFQILSPEHNIIRRNV